MYLHIRNEVSRSMLLKVRAGKVLTDTDRKVSMTIL